MAQPKYAEAYRRIRPLMEEAGCFSLNHPGIERLMLWGGFHGQLVISVSHSRGYDLFYQDHSNLNADSRKALNQGWTITPKQDVSPTIDRTHRELAGCQMDLEELQTEGNAQSDAYSLALEEAVNLIAEAAAKLEPFITDAES